jgi:hypothetical protein
VRSMSAQSSFPPRGPGPEQARAATLFRPLRFLLFPKTVHAPHTCSPRLESDASQPMMPAPQQEPSLPLEESREHVVFVLVCDRRLRLVVVIDVRLCQNNCRRRRGNGGHAAIRDDIGRYSRRMIPL